MQYAPDDFELLQQLLEIYDQTFIGEYLNQTSPGQWCRETVNRWQRGKASPRLSHHEYQALLKLLPQRVDADRKLTRLEG